MQNRGKQKVCICPEDCQFSLDEGGCGSAHIDTIDDIDAPRYERDGDFPYCPFYWKPLTPLS